MPKASQTSASAEPFEDGAITVTTQQSRFHAQSAEAQTSRDVDIKGLSLSAGGRELLDHAHLRVVSGVHYVLTGRNGTGKSSLLRALAERLIPGVPQHLRLLLLGQTRISSDMSMDPASGDTARCSILEYVTKSDRRRERALEDANNLAAALEDKDDSSRIVKTMRSVKLQQAKQDLVEAKLVAARMTGARGAKARRLVIEKEVTVKELQAHEDDPVSAPDEEEATQAGLDMLEATRLALEAMDAGRTEARARNVLLGLGFRKEQIEKPIGTLSGGWQTRCDLACALIQQMDILMLDEPTNFLDLPAIIWLQRYIERSLATTSVIVVTHDRAFADSVAQELLLVRLAPAKTLEVFKGNLTGFESEKRRQIRRMTKMSEAQNRKTKHMEDTIAKNIKAARRTGDDKKLKQAASRRKKMDERTGLEVGQSGGRFKLNRDLAGWHSTNRSAIEIPEFDPPVTLALPENPSPLRHAGPLFSFSRVSFTYPRSGVWTLKEIDLVMHPGERIGLAGLNGSGKSTLVKLLMGAATGAGLRPTKGTIDVHSQARIACYSQNAVEELEAIGRQTPTRTALSHLMQLEGWTGDEQVARGTLAKLGLRGNIVTDVPLGGLSGGQRVRLALAESFLGSPHLLILDEVTTHLDADTIESLIEALEPWEGALLVITHDRHFMRCVVDRERLDRGSDDDDSDSGGSVEVEDATSGVVYHVRKAGLRRLERGMSQYEEIVAKQVDKLGL